MDTEAIAQRVADDAARTARVNTMLNRHIRELEGLVHRAKEVNNPNPKLRNVPNPDEIRMVAEAVAAELEDSLSELFPKEASRKVAASYQMGYTLHKHGNRLHISMGLRQGDAMPLPFIEQEFKKLRGVVKTEVNELNRAGLDVDTDLRSTYMTTSQAVVKSFGGNPVVYWNGGWSGEPEDEETLRELGWKKY